MNRRPRTALRACPLQGFAFAETSSMLALMKSPVLDALLESPVLPELIQEAQRALGREQRLREKFYADITPEQKWEFIQGEAIMHSPASSRHLQATMRTYKLLDAHVGTQNLGRVYVEKAMTCFPRNDYEPDVMFFGTAKTALILPDTLKFPIPDLIVEVLSPSTEARDRGIKLQDYALHGVAEYWIIDPMAETVEAHRLNHEGDAYATVPRVAEGVLTSDVVPGLELPVRALFDDAENLAVLRRLLSAG